MKMKRMMIALLAGLLAAVMCLAGAVAEGCLADALLIDLKNERLAPCHNLTSNWVYAADSNAIDSVICNGEFVMRNRHIDGEENIIREAEACAKRLAGKR